MQAQTVGQLSAIGYWLLAIREALAIDYWLFAKRLAIGYWSCVSPVMRFAGHALRFFGVVRLRPVV